MANITPFELNAPIFDEIRASRRVKNHFDLLFGMTLYT